MQEAARSGNLEALNYLFVHRLIKRELKILGSGVASGKIAVVEWLHTHGISSNINLLHVAAEKADLEMVQWVHLKCPMQSSSCDLMTQAAQKRVDMVKWFHENRSDEVTTEAMDRAAAGGHLDIVKFLHENRSEGFSTRAMSSAAFHGHLEVVKVLDDNVSERNVSGAMAEAIAQGHGKILRWLHEANLGKCSLERSLNVAYYSEVSRDIVAYLAKYCDPKYDSYDV